MSTDPPLPEHHRAIMQARTVFLLLCILYFVLGMLGAIFETALIRSLQPQWMATVAVGMSLLVLVYPWKLSQPAARALLRSATETERLTTSRAVRNMFVGFSIGMSAYLVAWLIADNSGGAARSLALALALALIVIASVASFIALTAVMIVLPALLYQFDRDRDDR